ncbi:hypothetical protein BDW22DRAFT_1363699 [Trametopsis cervina]|nr:hypothetical protein BDW22DRAFT_1363699 [Trametopsis cervina]
MNTGGTSDSNREDERQCTETETTTPSRSDNDAAEPLNTRGTNNSENIVGVEHDDEDVGEDNTDRVSFESWSQWVAGQ